MSMSPPGTPKATEGQYLSSKIGVKIVDIKAPKLMDKYNSLITPEYMKTEKNNFTKLFGKYVED